MSKALYAAFACTVCMSLGLAPLFMGTFPVFLGPVSRELGWGAAIFPQAALMAGVSGSLAGPFIGQLIDRLGVRPVLITGLLVWAAALFAMSYLDGSRIQLLSLAIVMGVAACACGPVALAKIVAGWFDRHRGLTLGIVMSAAPAIATAIMVMVASALIAAHGWRFTYRSLAAVVIVLAVPIALLFMREAEGADARSAGVLEAGKGQTAFQALRSRDFWLVMLVTALVCSVVNALVSHFVPWSAEHDIPVESATLALSGFSLLAPLGPLLAGALADRVGGPKALSIFYGLPLCGFALLVTGGPAVVVPAMVLLGLGFSAATGMLPYLLTRYFGVQHASQLFGVGLGVVTLSMGSGPVILGVVRDHLHTFGVATPALLCLLVGALGTSLVLRRF